MENMNLLDLNNDILNIIGGYVKKDNHDRLQREDVIRNSITLFEILKKAKWNDDKPSMRHLIVNYLYVNNIRDIETIDMYLTLMKLNLKQKKYTFSTYCIYNLEESIKIYDKILEKNTLNVKKLCFLCII